MCLVLPVCFIAVVLIYVSRFVCFIAFIFIFVALLLTFVLVSFIAIFICVFFPFSSRFVCFYFHCFIAYICFSKLYCNFYMCIFLNFRHISFWYWNQCTLFCLFLLCFILMKNLSIRFESLNKLFTTVWSLHFTLTILGVCGRVEPKKRRTSDDDIILICQPYCKIYENEI